MAWRLRCAVQLDHIYQPSISALIQRILLLTSPARYYVTQPLCFANLFCVPSSPSAQRSSRISSMGLYISKLLSSIQWGSKKLAILMLGLDNAGKTTLLYKLKLGDRVDTVPTIGFNVESIQYRKVNFTVWDVGGQDKIRPLWKYYFNNAQGLIFVVDSNDRDRLAEARDELQRLLGDPELERVKVLVFANKQDLPRAVNVAEVTEKLGLTSLRGRQWFVQGCCGSTGEGLHEGLDWLATALRDL